LISQSPLNVDQWTYPPNNNLHAYFHIACGEGALCQGLGLEAAVRWLVSDSRALRYGSPGHSAHILTLPLFSTPTTLGVYSRDECHHNSGRAADTIGSRYLTSTETPRVKDWGQNWAAYVDFLWDPDQYPDVQQSEEYQHEIASTQRTFCDFECDDDMATFVIDQVLAVFDENEANSAESIARRLSMLLFWLEVDEPQSPCIDDVINKLQYDVSIAMQLLEAEIYQNVSVSALGKVCCISCSSRTGRRRVTPHAGSPWLA
jgi:hypothetical protein